MGSDKFVCAGAFFFISLYLKNFAVGSLDVLPFPNEEFDFV